MNVRKVSWEGEPTQWYWVERSDLTLPLRWARVTEPVGGYEFYEVDVTEPVDATRAAYRIGTAWLREDMPEMGQLHE